MKLKPPTQEIPVSDCSTGSTPPTERTSRQVARESRQVATDHRPGHPSKFRCSTSRVDCNSHRLRPSSAGWVTSATRAHTPRHTPRHRQSRPPTTTPSRVDRAPTARCDRWVPLSARARWHPGESSGFGSVRGGPPLPHLRTHPCDPSRSLFYTVGYAGSPTL